MSVLVAVILAAGNGTRLKSKLPKVLHKIGGKPMLQHVLDAADAAGAARKVVVVGHEAELVEAMVGETTTMLRWRSRCQAGDVGDHDVTSLMEIKSTR